MTSVIAKRAVFSSSRNAMEVAGHRAEEQMAFYLERAFGSREDVFVLNDVRLEKGDDAAQIDHLVLHRWGIVIVESKSVTGTIKVNAQGEWMRVSEGKKTGMASPLLQVERQATFLRGYLNDHAESLLKKMLGFLQPRFGNMPIDPLVAISDHGIIERDSKVNFPGLMKADQVTSIVDSLLGIHRKEANPLSPGKEGWLTLSTADQQRIADFLVQHHKPRYGTQTPKTASDTFAVSAAPAWRIAETTAPVYSPTSANPAPPSVQKDSTFAENFACRHCGSNQLVIVYGKDYYFKCRACTGNTPTRPTCSRCKTREKLRKDGRQFSAKCIVCETERPFYKNPA
jgi:hypothetical protein